MGVYGVGVNIDFGFAGAVVGVEVWDSVEAEEGWEGEGEGVGVGGGILI